MRLPLLLLEQIAKDPETEEFTYVSGGGNTIVATRVEWKDDFSSGISYDFVLNPGD